MQVKRSKAKPTHISRITRGTTIKVAEEGAAALGMSLFWQGAEVARVLESRGTRKEFCYSQVVVQMPRRATKTTAIWATLIGRCMQTPNYRVVTTAQDGTRAGAKMREHMDLLAANGFSETKGNRLYYSNGKERINFENGSVLWVVAPKPSAFRSSAADVVFVDEAGELDPELGPDLLSAALPLMDTRENPQVIVAGTPGRRREGLLWEALERGRSGTKRVGIVDYSVRDDEILVTFDENGVKTLDVDVLARVHPGVGTLTTVARMLERFEQLEVAEFEMEYGCRWPADSTTGAIDTDKWADGTLADMQRPDRVGIAFDVAVDGSSASIAYAWRVDGVAHVEVVAHRMGTGWLAPEAVKASEKYRRVPISYDNIGSNLDPAQVLTRCRPQPRHQALMMKETLAAAQRLASEIAAGSVRHLGQSDLNAAVGNAAWREVAKSGRAFGPKDRRGAAMNPLVAVSLALWSYDKDRGGGQLRIAV